MSSRTAATGDDIVVERRRRARRDHRPAGLVVGTALATVVTMALGLVTALSVDDRTRTTASPDERTASPRSASDVPSRDNAGAVPPPAVTATPTDAHGGSAPGATGTPSEAPGELADHPLLRAQGAGLRQSGCGLPAWQGKPGAARSFFDAARRCLDAAWRPVLREHNLPFHPPKLRFPSTSSFSTACGTISIGVATAAYYCENTLYVPFTGLQTGQYGRRPGVYLALFAHEYGHHVQELAGIMDAAWERIYSAGRQSERGLEMARRKELQAQCLSGMFMTSHVNGGGSITRDMFANAWADQASRGDDNAGTRSHGSNEHYAQWWRKGARTNDLAVCNTFTAPSAAVS